MAVADKGKTVEEFLRELKTQAEKPNKDQAQADVTKTIKSLKDTQKVIYGTDDRVDIYQLGAGPDLDDVDCVVALFQAGSVTDNGNGTSTLNTQNFGVARNLCAGERFRDQPIGAFCSGFLVAPDIIATAGHCVNSNNVTNVRFVFGFRMSNATTAETVINNGEIYNGVSVVGHQLNGNGADWCLVRVDRSVPNHRVAPVRMSGRIDDSQALHVIGHPSGLPTKFAGGAAVRNNQANSFFVANLDTYGGNSGSPVFNSSTHKVEGILVRGETDFVSQGTCNISLVCPTAGCRGEDCTRTTEFAHLINNPELVVRNFGYNAGGWRVNMHPRFLSDITGDEQADIIGFGNAGVYVSLNNGDGTFQNLTRVVNNFGYNAGGWRVERHPRFLADLTGDKRDDIIGFGNAGVYASLNNGNASFQNPNLVVSNFGYNAGGWRVERHPRLLSDLTGNGRADIIGFGNAGAWASINNGNGTFQNPMLAIGNFGYNAGGWRIQYHPRFLADVTGDGCADIVGFGNAGVYVSLNNGDGTFQNPNLVVNNFGYNAGGWRVNMHPRMLADLTGNGCADIVGFGNAGVYVSLNNGDGTFQNPGLVVNNFGYNAGGWRINMHPRMLADLTGNGRADIVGFGNAGVWASLNNGNGTFQGPQLIVANFGYNAGGWRIGRHPRFLAKLSGNERADILGFGNAGAWMSGTTV